MKLLTYVLMLLLSSFASAKKQGVNPRPLSESERTVLGVTLGKTEFAKAIELFGTGTASASGDASTSHKSLCFAGKDKTVVDFSRGEEGGLKGEDSVHRVEIFANRKSGNCATSNKVDRSVATGIGLRLGLTQEEVSKLLGPPSSKDKREMSYIFASKLNAPGCESDGGWTIYESYLIKFTDGKANYIRVYSQGPQC